MCGVHAVPSQYWACRACALATKEAEVKGISMSARGRITLLTMGLERGHAVSSQYRACRACPMTTAEVEGH